MLHLLRRILPLFRSEWPREAGGVPASVSRDLLRKMDQGDRAPGGDEDDSGLELLVLAGCRRRLRMFFEVGEHRRRLRGFGRSDVQLFSEEKDASHLL